MGVILLRGVALLACFAPLAARAETPAGVEQTCKVIEAAYTAASESRVLAYPADIDPSFHMLELARIVPDYGAGMALTAKEFEGLKARASLYEVAKFRPLCLPASQPSTARDAEGHPMRVSFSSPVFSADGRLAITEVSFQEVGFGYGLLCIARREADRWSAKCRNSWIT